MATGTRFGGWNKTGTLAKGYRNLVAMCTDSILWSCLPSRQRHIASKARGYAFAKA